MIIIYSSVENSKNEPIYVPKGTHLYGTHYTTKTDSGLISKELLRLKKKKTTILVQLRILQMIL